VASDVYHAYHLYVIQVEDRKALFDYMRSLNIFVQVHYEPVHLMPYYRQFGNKEGDLPVVENYSKHCLTLPIYPTLTEEEQDFVIEKIKEFYKR
jgi:dTDP-4-amino-4,6-dideoxygalactose transaminase